MWHDFGPPLAPYLSDQGRISAVWKIPGCYKAKGKQLNTEVTKMLEKRFSAFGLLDLKP